jgi:hypothetical protein
MELETLRKIRKGKWILKMVNVLWQRARADPDLQFVTLELMFGLSVLRHRAELRPFFKK